MKLWPGLFAGFAIVAYGCSSSPATPPSGSNVVSFSGNQTQSGFKLLGVWSYDKPPKDKIKIAGFDCRPQLEGDPGPIIIAAFEFDGSNSSDGLHIELANNDGKALRFPVRSHFSKETPLGDRFTSIGWVHSGYTPDFQNCEMRLVFMNTTFGKWQLKDLPPCAELKVPIAPTEGKFSALGADVAVRYELRHIGFDAYERIFRVIVEAKPKPGAEPFEVSFDKLTQGYAEEDVSVVIDQGGGESAHQVGNEFIALGQPIVLGEIRKLSAVPQKLQLSGLSLVDGRRLLQLAPTKPTEVKTSGGVTVSLQPGGDPVDSSQISGNIAVILGLPKGTGGLKVTGSTVGKVERTLRTRDGRFAVLFDGNSLKGKKGPFSVSLDIELQEVKERAAFAIKLPKPQEFEFKYDPTKPPGMAF